MDPGGALPLPSQRSCPKLGTRPTLSLQFRQQTTAPTPAFAASASAASAPAASAAAAAAAAEAVQAHPNPVQGHPNPVQGHRNRVQGHPNPVQAHPNPVRARGHVGEWLRSATAGFCGITTLSDEGSCGRDNSGSVTLDDGDCISWERAAFVCRQLLLPCR